MRIIVNCADTLYKRVFPNSRQVELLDDIPAFELLGGWDLCICGFLYVVIVFFSRLVTSDWNLQQKYPWKCPEINPINSQKSHEIPMSFPRFFLCEIRKFPVEVMEVPIFDRIWEIRTRTRRRLRQHRPESLWGQECHCPEAQRWKERVGTVGIWIIYWGYFFFINLFGRYISLLFIYLFGI